MEEHTKENKTGNMLQYVALGLMGLVLVVSIMQAIAINSLASEISAGKGITSNSMYREVTAAPAQSPVQSAATQSQPEMVGGC